MDKTKSSRWDDFGLSREIRSIRRYTVNLHQLSTPREIDVDAHSCLVEKPFFPVVRIYKVDLISWIISGSNSVQRRDDRARVGLRLSDFVKI